MLSMDREVIFKKIWQPQLSFLYKESLHIGLYLSYMHCPFKELLAVSHYSEPNALLAPSSLHLDLQELYINTSVIPVLNLAWNQLSHVLIFMYIMHLI